MKHEAMERESACDTSLISIFIKYLETRLKILALLKILFRRKVTIKQFVSNSFYTNIYLVNGMFYLLLRI